MRNVTSRVVDELVASELAALAATELTRILDILILTNDQDRVIEAFETPELDTVETEGASHAARTRSSWTQSCRRRSRSPNRCRRRYGCRHRTPAQSP